jgi:hypothetical protein
MTGCFLCGNNRAEISLYVDDRDTRLVTCPNCGAYRISTLAIIEIDNGTHKKKIFPLIAGEVFDCSYYKNEVKVVITDDFRAVKQPMTTLEKLYRLAKFVYTESQHDSRKGLPYRPRPACCYADGAEYAELRKELKQLGILDFQEIIQEGSHGTPTTIISNIRLTLTAKMAFEEGINTAQEFKEAFMEKGNHGDTITIGGIYGGENQIGGSGNTMMSISLDSAGMIRAALKEHGVSDQQIASIEPEIIAIGAECEKETVAKGKLQGFLSKVAEKAGSVVRDIISQVITHLIINKIT